MTAGGRGLPVWANLLARRVQRRHGVLTVQVRSAQGVLSALSLACGCGGGVLALSVALPVYS